MDIHTRILQYSRLVKLLVPVTSTRTVVNLSFKIMGSPEGDLEYNPPVIICHGLLGTKDNWKSLGKTIQTITNRVVVRVDLRNHGSSPHTKTHRYDDQAADVLQLMKKLNVSKATLIGHDMGGRTAMCLALMEPAAVASLIVLDMSPVSVCTEFEEFYPKLMDTMMKVEWPEKKKVHKARKAAKKQLKTFIHDETIMGIILSNINIKQDGIIGWISNLGTLRKQFKYISTFPTSIGKGKPYWGPTLLIGGQMSEYLPADDLPKIRELFPAAVVKFVPGAGHFVHTDDPKAVLELAIDFLRSEY